MNHTRIYSVFSMCLGNLNARFIPIFLKITLIPHFLMFCRIRRKIKQSDGRNQVSLGRRVLPRQRESFVDAKLKNADEEPRVC